MTKRWVTGNDVVTSVAAFTGFSVDEITLIRRGNGVRVSDRLLRARYLVWGVLRHYGWSYPDIAHFAGVRSHATVYSALKRFPPDPEEVTAIMLRVDRRLSYWPQEPREGVQA